MSNQPSSFPSVFATLVVIGVACTGCNAPELARRFLQSPLNNSQQSANQTLTTSNPNLLDGQVRVKPSTAANVNESFWSSQKPIDIVLFLMGTTGIALGLLGLNKAKQVEIMSEQQGLSLNSLDRKLDDYSTIKKSRFMLEEALKKQSKHHQDLENRVDQLERKYAVLSTKSEYQVPNQLPSSPSTRGVASLNQPADLLRTNTNQNRPPAPSLNLFGESHLQPNANPFGSTPVKTAAQKQEDLTAAVNRNDRQAVKNATSTQINITNDSDNAIATGRLTQTELEEVSGGGSYLLMVIENQGLLYPTEQTLNGFGQLQPVKGVFSYLKQSIATPQVIKPALVERVGNNWRVQQLGTIAVPS